MAVNPWAKLSSWHPKGHPLGLYLVSFARLRFFQRVMDFETGYLEPGVLASVTKTKVGVVGQGRFGSRILKALEENENVQVIWKGGSELKWWAAERPDWVFLASPHEFHYEQALHFLKRGVNVFVEKPATLDRSSLESLLASATESGAKLYVDDVYSFRKPERFMSAQRAYVTQNSESNFVDLMAYHHLYLIRYEFGSQLDIEAKIDGLRLGPSRYEVAVSFTKKLKFHFTYDLNNPDQNDSLDYREKGDALSKMIRAVIAGDVDYEKNHDGALFAAKISAQIKSFFFGEALVVGAGIYGCCTAIELSKAGYKVTLIEQKDSVLAGASFTNQYRIHLGFHYPRSEETRRECIEAAEAFKRTFPQCIDDSSVHLYSVAEANSLTKPEAYLRAMSDSGLKFEVLPAWPKTALTIKTQEVQFNPFILKSTLESRLFGAGIELKLNEVWNRDAAESLSDRFAIRVHAKYSRTNEGRSEKQQMKFQLVEKIVVELPEDMANLSMVVMDGPFFSVDPFPGTPYHVLGAVVEANLEVIVGDEPKFDSVLGLDSGILQVTPPVSKHRDIVKLAESFLGDGKIRYVGSFFVTKALKAQVESSDERRHAVEKDSVTGDIHIFGGKISAAVLAARKVLQLT